MNKKNSPDMQPLRKEESLYYRDVFRSARYAALADAESFSEICFALEALGLRLLGCQCDMKSYMYRIGLYAAKSVIFSELSMNAKSGFKTFEALYEIVRNARNDVMHSGSYARHATQAAIELCIGLEEALMMEVTQTVGDLMVKSPIVIERWQPVAHARQLMLMHSFSFLPVQIDGSWWLLSEVGLAKFLCTSNKVKRERLGQTIEDSKVGLDLLQVTDQDLLSATDCVKTVLSSAKVKNGPTLWLVVDKDRLNYLVGVLSPFELM